MKGRSGQRNHSFQRQSNTHTYKRILQDATIIGIQWSWNFQTLFGEGQCMGLRDIAFYCFFSVPGKVENPLLVSSQLLILFCKGNHPSLYNLVKLFSPRFFIGIECVPRWGFVISLNFARPPSTALVAEGVVLGLGCYWHGWTGKNDALWYFRNKKYRYKVRYYYDIIKVKFMSGRLSVLLFVINTQRKGSADLNYDTFCDFLNSIGKKLRSYKLKQGVGCYETTITITIFTTNNYN